MKLEGPVRIKEERASGAKKAFTLLVAVVLAISVRVFVQEDHFVRELLLFVACAALFVFFAAHLGLLGILFHAAGRSIVPCFRKPRIAPRAQGGSRQHAGPLVGSPTMDAAARFRPLYARAGPDSLFRGSTEEGLVVSRGM